MISENPTMNLENSTMNLENSTRILENPTMNLENSTKILENPTMNLENPTMNLENPTMILENPTMNLENPTMTKITIPKYRRNLTLCPPRKESVETLLDADLPTARVAETVGEQQSKAQSVLTIHVATASENGKEEIFSTFRGPDLPAGNVEKQIDPPPVHTNGSHDFEAPSNLSSKYPETSIKDKFVNTHDKTKSGEKPVAAPNAGTSPELDGTTPGSVDIIAKLPSPLTVNEHTVVTDRTKLYKEETSTSAVPSLADAPSIAGATGTVTVQDPQIEIPIVPAVHTVQPTRSSVPKPVSKLETPDLLGGNANEHVIPPLSFSSKAQTSGSSRDLGPKATAGNRSTNARKTQNAQLDRTSSAAGKAKAVIGSKTQSATKPDLAVKVVTFSELKEIRNSREGFKVKKICGSQSDGSTTGNSFSSSSTQVAGSTDINFKGSTQMKQAPPSLPQRVQDLSKIEFTVENSPSKSSDCSTPVETSVTAPGFRATSKIQHTKSPATPTCASKPFGKETVANSKKQESSSIHTDSIIFEEPVSRLSSSPGTAACVTENEHAKPSSLDRKTSDGELKENNRLMSKRLMEKMQSVLNSKNTASK